jgi:hypothetical protein
VTDRRSLRSNGRVADRSLKGEVEADSFVEPQRHRVRWPVAAIYAGSTGVNKDRELAFGEGFEVLGTEGTRLFGYATRDGYVGYVDRDALAPYSLVPTHRVIAPTYWHSEPRLKCGYEPTPMPIGARVAVATTHRDHCDWAEIDLPAADTEDTGSAVYVPMPHLMPLEPLATDPVAEAERYLGVPYLWAGNSGFGIDCSGLVQAACLACGIACPGDSDQQAAELGVALPDDVPLQRNDLIFWKGHVAWVVGDGRILHANARDMAVAYEDMKAAIDRIAVSDGPVTGRRRLALG